LKQTSNVELIIVSAIIYKCLCVLALAAHTYYQTFEKIKYTNKLSGVGRGGESYLQAGGQNLIHGTAVTLEPL